MNPISFTLPSVPPPLSACFVNVKRNGRADTPRYKTWKINTDVDLLTWCPVCTKDWCFTGTVRVTYTIKRPDRRARDLDNLLKALNDTLTRNRIVKDDSQIVDLRIMWGDWFTTGEVHVVIEEVREAMGTQVAA